MGPGKLSVDHGKWSILKVKRGDLGAVLGYKSLGNRGIGVRMLEEIGIEV